MNARRSVTTLAAVLCAAAGTAAAQETGCCSKGDARDIVVEEVQMVHPVLGGLHDPHGRRVYVAGSPLRGMTLQSAGQPETKTISRTVMIQSDGEHEYKVEIENDDVKAWIDGERVPQDRLKVKDGQIILKGADGETVMEFDRAVTVTQPGQFRFGEGVESSPLVWSTQEGMEPFAFQAETEHPPVMIGINMGPLEDIDDEVQSILDDRELDPEDVIVVVGVVDELPAAEAGVHEGDVIVRLDGEWGVDPEKLRAVLMSKEPGDEIELLVIRDGERKEISIELAPYDPERLGESVAPQGGMGFEHLFGGAAGDEELQALIERLQAQSEHLDKDLQKDIKKLVERLHSQEFNRFQLDELPRFRVYGDTGVPRALVAPRAPSTPAPPTADAMRGYQERFDRIEGRLDRIEQRLDRLIAAMESRERDRE